MTRISVSLEDATAEALKSAAGGEGKVSGYVARLVREKLIGDAAVAAGAFDRQGEPEDDLAWEAERLAGHA
ncbi:hypothetical protein [Actinoplanes sp. NPDC051851]|uniref:hypothetical protein n=1 Tax=Actinoplanes sp. NPDC051851 TaxID=3154753 RepID=UPI00343B07B2